MEPKTILERCQDLLGWFCDHELAEIEKELVGLRDGLARHKRRDRISMLMDGEMALEELAKPVTIAPAEPSRSAVIISPFQPTGDAM